MRETDLDWRDLMAAPAPRSLCPRGRHRPALYPLHLRNHREAQGRGQGQRRPRGRAHLVDAQHLRHARAKCSGPPPTSAGWSATRTSSTRRSSGCTTILYEGKLVGTPNASDWRVIAEHKVKTLFTAPTDSARSARRTQAAGSRSGTTSPASSTCSWRASASTPTPTAGRRLLNVPVIDHWWQTETGWAIVANPVGLDRKPTKPGSPSLPVPGYDVQILDEDGKRVKPGEAGNIAIKLPLPPSCLPTLWHNDEGFVRSYLSRYPGYYLTGDGGLTDEDGYLYVMGRIDDVINVAGHRLSTGEMEEILASHPAVAECAVFGVNDAIKGEVPRGLVVLKAGVAARTGTASGGTGPDDPRPHRPHRHARQARHRARPSPRPGRGRSSGGPCAASRTAGTNRSRPPSMTCPSSTTCGQSSAVLKADPALPGASGRTVRRPALLAGAPWPPAVASWRAAEQAAFVLKRLLRAAPTARHAGGQPQPAAAQAR